MSDPSKKANSEATETLSEAERMARIRDLLVGPVIADEQVRRDQSIGRLDQSIADQSQTIAALTARISDLEQAHRLETERLDLRLLGMVEALITDEKGLRDRLAKSDQLKAYVGEVQKRAKGSDQAN